MPYKDLEVRKAYHREKSRKHYEKNRVEVIKKTQETKKASRLKWRVFKSTLRCVTCGFAHPAALDFHHEDPSKKEATIHSLLQNGQFTKAYEEVKKCIVLCANCHRIHHHDERIKKKNHAA
jgi:hypothetical protein